MTTRVRTLFVAAVLLATLWLVGCDHYTCSATFGNSSCTASGSGLGTTGGGGNTSSAFVYAVDEGTSGSTNGTIDGYAFDSTTLAFGPITSYTAPTVPINNGGVGMVVAQGINLYAGFGTVQQLYGWVISSSGSLTAIPGSPFAVPALDGFISGVGQANMITNPAGTLLFISDAVNQSIDVYSIGTGGVIAQVGSFACPAGFTPMNLATDGLGKYLYAIDGTYNSHQGTKIAAFSIGSGTSLGTLTPVTGSPFAFPMWQVKGEPTGKFLIGTTGTTAAYNGHDDDNLYVFSIGTGGALTQVTKQSTVYTPFSIAVPSNTSGELVYSLGFNDTATGFNPVEGYAISSSGTLTAVSGSPFSLGEGSWGQFDQSGALLFSYASFLNTSTNTIVTQLSPLAVGSGGVLTQPASTLTLVTPGFWAVADVP